jgi:uncharacterized OB-fold protein
MRKYDLYGYEVKITTAQENYMYIQEQTDPIIDEVESKFENWYTKQGNCENVYKNESDIISSCAYPLTKKGLELLKNQKVYTIDEELLFKKYLIDCFDEWEETLESMINQISDIESDKAAAIEYRKMRKASRSRIVGGGFGLGGAIKGMAAAGSINMATGAAHTITNTMGNIGSSIVSASKKSQVYKEYRKQLLDALFSTIYSIRRGIMNALTTEGGMEFKYVTKDEAKRAEIIIKNIETGSIPTDDRLPALIEAIKLDYSNELTYFYLWEFYGDKSGQLSVMADDFGIELDEYIEDKLNDICEKIYQKNCADYIKSKNKYVTAVKHEANIKATYDYLVGFCKDNDLDPTDYDKINELKSLLDFVDKQCKIVDGKLWSSREKANQIQNDINKFYEYLSDKDINEVGIFDELLSLEYETQEFRDDLVKRYQNEIYLRDPLKLYENINKIIQKTFLNETKIKDKVDVAKIDNNLQVKEEVIRKITGMNADEVPVLFIDRSFTQKGKSGILFTNYNFRNFDKGLIGTTNDSYDLHSIESLEYLGVGNFSLLYNGNTFKFSIDLNGITLEKQNEISDCLWDVIEVIRNIPFRIRQKLNYIEPESVLCSCGSYIRSGKKFCNVCGRKVLDNGATVETVNCAKCGEPLIKGKKFCNRCGTATLYNELLKENNEITDLDNAVDRDNTDSQETTQELMGIQINKESLEIEELSVSIIQCPSCGKDILPNKKFCSNCGNKIERM